MTALNASNLAEIPQLRPLNPLRDLPAVANLVEECFANTLDESGRRHIEEMRNAAQSHALLRWVNSALDTISMPLSGYVWEENGKIIGNVSLIPHRYKKKRYYLIANVAVSPEYRRRGIGRALTLAAMDYARQRHADEVWLHVRDDNPGAIALYQALGFVELARRTQWQGKPDRNACTDGLGVVISDRIRDDWPRQEAWLQRLYPDLLHWYQGIPWNSLRPGIRAAFYRFIMEEEVQHWVARQDNTPTAILSWRASSGKEQWLWAAVPPEGSERPLTALLLHARRALAWREMLILDFPSGEYREAIEAAGFRPRRTLLWMKLAAPDSVHSS